MKRNEKQSLAPNPQRPLFGVFAIVFFAEELYGAIRGLV